MIPKNTICLWFDKDAEEAARFYVSIFKNSKVVRIARPGLGVRVAAHRVVVVHLGRAMDGHKMGMDAPVVAQVIAGLHPADQWVGRAAQQLQ